MKLSEGLRKGLAIKEKIGRPYCAAVIVAAGTSSRMGGTNKMCIRDSAGHGRREPGMLGSRRQRLRERTLLSSDLNRKPPQ